MTNPKLDNNAKYLINTICMKPQWTGPVWGFHSFRNPNWLNSAYLGTVWNLLCLPERFWHEVCRTTWYDGIRGGLFGLVALIYTFFAFIWFGLTGRLQLLPLGLDVLLESHVMDEVEAQKDFDAGNRMFIRATQ